ncbi:MAG: protoporphyrinogen oxidase [uncultured bacterium]|nr:MAG: protoporphyrinogen oxidase [uncultured bacterium]OGJ48124.1 MAG: hypothetical protein A2244_01395 [Candidatus Peregrinibacteria bacterium RIFOXYA2_FULL_41_18]OGJ49027.1 MAG: hypothetical protein A2344_00640 [Candidatus Peregrinibacteria bacterium RIFOXYB12_FULL_41_12]OGJ52414.1 MAG: hypothetical protein A2336_04610 [Candidatus Peregrinibacteria bacterium RIFOXYB2_FULL_41_88]OGJ53408.1 MAG: hypothetical protein A2448_05070 [Candidatus Peregrinibacteria bacterium RIFOXYC2_FULL_41_22]
MKIETLIIGGGISGLACANKLSANGRDFLLVTENIGGRITHSKDGKVCYGAYFVMKNYHNVKRFVRQLERISPLNVRFHKEDRVYSAFSFGVVKHFGEFLRTVRILFRFKKHYETFKKNCEMTPQADALEQDPYLWKLYNQKASDFINEQRIGYIAENYLAQMTHGTTFTPTDRIDAMLFLLMSLPVIVPTYKFEFLDEKISGNVKDKTVFASVKSIKKDRCSYRVKSSKGDFIAKNIVVATPPHVSKKLLGLGKIKAPTNAHMFHIKGELREQCGIVSVFDESDSTLALTKEQDGTFLFYSLLAKPAFSKYFIEHKIICHKFWNPAFNLSGFEVLKCKLAKNLYLIGDHNVCNMEDSFITGVYAANRILGMRQYVINSKNHII